MIDNFEKLVARCETARRRRMIRLSFLIVGSFLFLISAVAGYQMWRESRLPSEPLIQKTTPTTPELNATDLTPIQENNETLPLPASPRPAVETMAVPIAPPTAAPAIAKPVESVNHTSAVVEKPAPASVPKGESLFEVNTQTAQNPVEAYKTSPNYAAALAAARDFYARENYTDAAIWAKKANQLNREAEEAWLLYAKSYYAQGRKNEAMGILGLYLNYKDSKAASELLRTWKQTPAN